ncbi:hypothetical protein JBE04_12335 [Streptomyces sp. PRKS01-29]|nr:hypothetical protein [Streptomyces sabulosicollis]MBI0295239.1 hypothetical protein [Streptomyces sabulosicollis]
MASVLGFAGDPSVAGVAMTAQASLGRSWTTAVTHVATAPCTVDWSPARPFGGGVVPAVEAEPFASFVVFVFFVSFVFDESAEHPARTGTAAITHMPTIQPTAFFFDLAIPTSLTLPQEFLIGKEQPAATCPAPPGANCAPSTEAAREARPPATLTTNEATQ